VLKTQICVTRPQYVNAVSEVSEATQLRVRLSPTPWNTVLRDKLTGCHLVKKFLHFLESEVSLQCLQEPAIGPYSEPPASSPPS